MTAAYWAYAVLSLIGIGVTLNQIDQPRKPLTAGAALFGAAISGFGAYLFVVAALR